MWKVSWTIKSVLKGAFQVLHGTLARREDCLGVTGCSKYPLFFRATRFLMKFLKVTSETPFRRTLYHIDMVEGLLSNVASDIKRISMT